MSDAPTILGRDDLVAGLRGLGIRAGDGVFCHVSLGAVGHVIGGPRGLIEALIEAVGPEGLIGMPGFSRDAYDPLEFVELDVSEAEHARIRAQVPGYDPALSDVRQNGAVPEAFRTWPGIVRSPHPTSSVLLHGKGAAELASPHDARGWATGPETPWDRLRTRPNMKILLIGVGWNRCSALHAAESLALHKRLKMRHLKLAPSEGGEWIDAPDVADDLDRLFPLVGAAWEDAGGVDTGQLGGAECRLTDYGALLEFASDWMDTRNAADGVPPHP
ncbi:MAG: AAC(3) family N-acetyltransferase [Pseudomonadota bacterium]